MAEQMDKAMIAQVKEMYPDYTVMAYVNTTAELKTIADVCVTSSSAVKIAKAIDSDKILFIPDCNLGAFTAKACPDKTFKLLQGGCPVHAAVPPKAVAEAKALHTYEISIQDHADCCTLFMPRNPETHATLTRIIEAWNALPHAQWVEQMVKDVEYRTYSCPSYKPPKRWREPQRTEFDVINERNAEGGSL